MPRGLWDLPGPGIEPVSPALQGILLKWLRNFNHWSTREAPCPGFCALNFLPQSLQACNSKPNSSSICALVSPSENWEKTMAVIVIYFTGWSLGYSRQSRQRAENRAGPEKALLSLQSCPTLNSFHSKLRNCCYVSGSVLGAVDPVTFAFL